MDTLNVGSPAPMTKRALLVLSHAMERAFDITTDADDGASGLVLGLFQRRQYLDVEVSRYVALVEAGHTVIVGFTGSTDGLPLGVHAVTFDEQDPRARDWALAMVRDNYATSLLAHDTFDLSTGEMTLQASRVFHAQWTFRRKVALSVTRVQLERLRPGLPIAVYTAALRQIENCSAIPVSAVEKRLATAADHLVTSVDAGQRRATRLRFELEASHHLAERDHLTGLNNRHYLERYLGNEGGPADLLALLVDVDDLKGVNDTEGHDAGDALLCAVAATLRDYSRPSDVVVRWGGDEFLLLVPGVPGEKGLEVGERLARAVASRPLPSPWEHLTPSVSIGMCWTRRTLLPIDRLDVALYRVKNSGKGHAAMETEPVLAD